MFTSAVGLSPRFIFAGRLQRDFVIYPDDRARLDVVGGNLIYAAAGLAVWERESPPGLAARVGEDYPRQWLTEIEQHGFDIRGIHILPQAIDLRSFYVYSDRTTRINDDPVAHFARLGIPFPRILLGYQAKTGLLDSLTQLAPTSLRPNDLPPDFLNATAIHLCPIDYLSHTFLPAVLRQAGFTLITLDPSAGYMNPAFREHVPALITGLTAFLPSETEVHALFHGQSNDLWEMAEALAAYGCEIVVIKRGNRGQILYEAASRTRWEIPPYPVRLVDPTGAGDAFCGGFLLGYRRTLDPLEATLYGNISASLTVEGHGPFYALGALPRLADARLEALRQTVRKV